MRKPIVALVGRPNVGKSTLFNRLAGRKLAIVEDEPGTTRDRLYAETEWSGRPFLVVDTGGLDVAATEKLPRKGKQPEALGPSSGSYAREIREQAEIAVREADVVVFVVDAKDGITSADRDVAEVLRRASRRVIVAANKADNERLRKAAVEFYELGLGEPFPISALHGTGTGDLLDAIIEHIPGMPEEAQGEAIHIAIVGRPNVGKSSLLNALLQEERSIVSPIPGTTRDAIDTDLMWNGQHLVLIDTAGIRRRGKIEQGVERYSVLRAFNAIQRADVALLVLDALEGVAAQDAHVAGFILEAYKGVIVVVNKWDAVPEKDALTMSAYVSEVRKNLRFLDYVPVIFVSALTRQRVSKILPLAVQVAEQRRMRVPPDELNRLLREAFVAHPLSLRHGDILRFVRAAQVGIEPPTFEIVVNEPREVHFSYLRYLENTLRGAFVFEGTPLRLLLRSARP